MTTKVIEHTQPSLSDMSDEYLVQLVLQNDQQAFELLYDRYVRVIFKRVRYVVPETDVEDVTQEVFLAMLTSLPSFRGEAQFGTWLRTLTKNKVAEYYRRRSRKKETMQVELVHAEKQNDDSKASSLEDRIAVRLVLTKLPEQYCEVLILRFAEEMQFNEIAKCLHKNLEATKSLFRRAMSAMEKELEIKNE